MENTFINKIIDNIIDYNGKEHYGITNECELYELYKKYCKDKLYYIPSWNLFQNLIHDNKINIPNEEKLQYFCSKRYYFYKGNIFLYKSIKDIENDCMYSESNHYISDDCYCDKLHDM